MFFVSILKKNNHVKKRFNSIATDLCFSPDIFLYEATWQWRWRHEAMEVGTDAVGYPIGYQLLW